MTTEPTHRAAKRPTWFALAFALAVALAVVAAACSSSKKADTSTNAGASETTSGADSGYAGAYGAKSSTTTTAPASGTGESIAVSTSSLGQIVVDSEGRTLYMYTPDTGPTSTCLDACAKAWPPSVVTGNPSAADGVTGTLTTTTRSDGSTQLVLNGHPLYRYSGDTAAGDTNGQGIGGIWYVLTPDGTKVGD